MLLALSSLLSSASSLLMVALRLADPIGIDIVRSFPTSRKPNYQDMQASCRAMFIKMPNLSAVVNSLADLCQEGILSPHLRLLDPILEPESASPPLNRSWKYWRLAFFFEHFVLCLLDLQARVSERDLLAIAERARRN